MVGTLMPAERIDGVRSDSSMDHGRVFAEGGKDAAEIDHLSAVESQRRDGGASCRGETDHFHVVVIPGEMLCPVLSAGMKERDEFMSQRIAGFEFGVFVVVAALTGEREIADGGRAASMPGDDVFDGKGMRGISRLAQTILTTLARPGSDEAAQFSAGGRFRHTPARAVRVPFGASIRIRGDRAARRVQLSNSDARHRTVPFAR